MCATHDYLQVIESLGAIDDRLLSTHRHKERKATYGAWPRWVDKRLKGALANDGITKLWSHQVSAAQSLHRHQPTIVSTGTGSGKSVAAWLAFLSQKPDATSSGLLEMINRPSAIYISPTKALARDQGSAIEKWAHAVDKNVGYADGDCPTQAKKWTRAYADIVVTNPDYIHYALLPNHEQWKRIINNLSLIVVDELHYYRGLMGAHLSHIIKRLIRLAKKSGADPVVCCLSATTANPAQAMARLIGVDENTVVSVDDDGSPQGRHTTVLWQPAIIDDEDDLECDASLAPPIRRHPFTEAGQLVGELIATGARVLCFASSRSGVESVADAVKNYSLLRYPEGVDKIAAYRGGYLPEERRELERRLNSGDLVAVAATSALELGIDISGLDVTVTLGWPGSRASFRQQSGRAGRKGNEGISIFVAGENPLDRYMLYHPEQIFQPVEATVFDPSNPHVSVGHIMCAAAEAPLTDSDIDLFGDHVIDIVHDLVAKRILQQRPKGLYYNFAYGKTPWSDIDIRGAGYQVTITDTATGQVIGTVDSARADAEVYPGAIYVHQGNVYKVDQRDERVAFVSPTPDTHRTKARADKSIDIIECHESIDSHGFSWHRGIVDVTSQVNSYGLYVLPTMTNVGEFPIDSPQRHMRTQAVWVTFEPWFLTSCGVDQVGEALHAMEHAAIGLLPTQIVCDRWDIGGLSIDIHPQTATATVFIYDGYEGGAGFSYAGFERRDAWIKATYDNVSLCECKNGCPACIQSPKCGNNNEFLHKAQGCALLEGIVKAST